MVWKGEMIMYLIYYVKNGVKGWFLSEKEETLQKWADENLDTSTMSGEDEYEIVDLARSDLQKELNECRRILKTIKDIVK
jgi:hypothetical protein